MGLSLTACKKEPAKQSQETFDTYVAVDLAFPTVSGVRALPQDYNENGTWQGRDVVKTVDIYVVNLTKNKVNHTRFNEAAIGGIGTDGKLTNKLAAKATAGDQVTAYAVVNDIDQKTNTLLAGVPAGQFDKKFSAVESEIKAEEIPSTNKFDAGNDIVMMTNKETPAPIIVKPNITEQQAKDGVANRIDIKVDRVVSRAIVTIAADLIGGEKAVISVKNAANTEVSKVKVTEITYSVGQGNKSFYLRQQADFKTPSYEWFPVGDFNTEAKKRYDYSGLENDQFKVPQAIAGKADVETALKAEQFSKFVLPVTHEYAQGATNNYKKGNTTYFEIRCKFTVQNVEGGVATDVTATEPDGSLYFGLDNGKFYPTKTEAENAADAKGQKVRKYDGAVMKYIIWLNPNTIEQRYELSPTVRNQVYHAHVKGFKEIGVAHNPLKPDEPKDPDNPIDPEDPLENSETHLSVEVQVLPWTIHSYEIDLSNKY